MIDSKIQWCDDTVNVVEGCEQVDADCRACYAMGIAARFAQDRVVARREEDGAPMETKPGHYAGLARLSPGRRLPQWTGKVRLRPDVLDAMFWRLLRARAPRRQFLCSMGDIFHAEVPDDFLDEVFARIAILESRRALTPSGHIARSGEGHHPMYLLTKRPDRAAEYTNAPDVERRIEDRALAFIQEIGRHAIGEYGRGRYSKMRASLVGFTMPRWPLRSVAIITSAGTQAGVDTRVKQLLDVNAAVLGVSVEPMTAPVDLSLYLGEVGWVIVGGESGDDARPCELSWIENVAAQAKRAQTLLFVKQLGNVLAAKLGREGKGGKIEDLPPHLRVRQFPRIPERA